MRALLIFAFTLLAPLLAVSGEPHELTDLRTAAERGDASAQLRLGVMYLKGDGVPQDKAEAERWLKKRRNGSLDTPAHFAEGLKHELGDGRNVDLAEALRCYRKAALNGHVEAKWKCVRFHAEGIGVPADPKEVVYWLRDLAQDTDAAALFALAVRLEAGEGVEPNARLARSWYRIASDEGHEGARNRLKELAALRDNAAPVDFYGMFDPTHQPRTYRPYAERFKNDPATRKSVFGEQVPAPPRFKTTMVDVANWMQIEQAGGSDAEYRLGMMHLSGNGALEVPSAAADWLKKAAVRGHPQAMKQLAWMYEMGWGVERDLDEAFNEYWRASAHADGMAELGFFHARRGDMGEARYFLLLAAKLGSAMAKERVAREGW